MSGEGDSRPSPDDYARLDGKVASLSAALLARKGAAAPSSKRLLADAPGNPFAGCPAARAARDCPGKAKAAQKRANVTLRLPIPDFLRLKLASIEFERTSQAILLEALRRHLDERGVASFDDCPCLEKNG